MNYEPRTEIADEAAIDLDQQKMSEQASLGHFSTAQHLYWEGGHTKSYAKLTLISPPGPRSYKKGTAVLGKTENGDNVFGELLEDTNWSNLNGGNMTINVLYPTSDEASQHVGCMVGGLWRLSEAVHAGCKYCCVVERSR